MRIYFVIVDLHRIRGILLQGSVRCPCAPRHNMGSLFFFPARIYIEQFDRAMIFCVVVIYPTFPIEAAD